MAFFLSSSSWPSISRLRCSSTRNFCVNCRLCARADSESSVRASSFSLFSASTLDSFLFKRKASFWVDARCVAYMRLIRDCISLSGSTPSPSSIAALAFKPRHGSSQRLHSSKCVFSPQTKKLSPVGEKLQQYRISTYVLTVCTRVKREADILSSQSLERHTHTVLPLSLDASVMCSSSSLRAKVRPVTLLVCFPLRTCFPAKEGTGFDLSHLQITISPPAHPAANQSS
mmetsp:Transcript_20208/g.51606  ORF Transcript_20208/g.51606 Transcript_20208/m.51606 type:complete len:229 (+) Transcript_20208:563-1249(+)